MSRDNTLCAAQTHKLIFSTGIAVLAPSFLLEKGIAHHLKQTYRQTEVEHLRNYNSRAIIIT